MDYTEHAKIICLHNPLLTLPGHDGISFTQRPLPAVLCGGVTTLSVTVWGGLWWVVGVAHQCSLAARWYGPRCCCSTALQAHGNSHACCCLSWNVYVRSLWDHWRNW